jgi:putative membrane protein
LTQHPVSGSIQMMKTILRGIVFYSVALFLTAQILQGVKMTGGLTTYLVGGIVLSILFFLVKPVLGIITLPLNIITLGLFSFVVNAIILYLLTIFVPNISITAFKFSGFSFLGFVAPQFSINNFFAFITASILISFIVGFLKWLIKK